jgi:replicative DNA helicase
MTETKLFSMEPETAVISMVLKNPAETLPVPGLRFFMFSSNAHMLIFREIEDLFEKQLLPDSALVINSLESASKLSAVGGKEYIEQLLTLDYPIANIHEYARLVVASYKARSLLTTISSVKTTELTIDSVDDVIGNFKKSLDTLMESYGGASTLLIGENIRKVYDEIIARMAHPGIRGLSWGISEINMATGGKTEGDLWIVASRPSMGKTSVILNAILEDGKNGIPCLFFEKEMDYQTLVERLVAIDTGIPLQNIRQGILKQEELKVVLDSINKIKTYPIFIDTNFLSDVYYLESTIARYTKLHGVKTVYLDYLQLFAERDDNQTHELGKISRMLKLSAVAHKLCIIAVSQLNRSVELRENKRPILSDLRQSGNLEEDADIVVGLYRDEYYNKESKNKGMMEFIIMKARNGPIGTLTLKFIAETNKVDKL